jgi:hypothetical protein
MKDPMVIAVANKLYCKIRSMAIKDKQSLPTQSLLCM